MEILKDLTLVTFSLGDSKSEYKAGDLAKSLVSDYISSFEGLEKVNCKNLFIGVEYTLIGNDGSLKACLNGLLVNIGNTLTKLNELLVKVQNATDAVGGRNMLYNFFRVDNAGKFEYFEWDSVYSLCSGIDQLEVWSNKLKELCESI